MAFLTVITSWLVGCLFQYGFGARGQHLTLFIRNGRDIFESIARRFLASGNILLSDHTQFAFRGEGPTLELGERVCLFYWSKL